MHHMRNNSYFPFTERGCHKIMGWREVASRITTYAARRGPLISVPRQIGWGLWRQTESQPHLFNSSEPKFETLVSAQLHPRGTKQLMSNIHLHSFLQHAFSQHFASPSVTCTQEP